MQRTIFFFVSLLFVTLTSAQDVPMRGVVLTGGDLATVDWAKLARENGINTIGTHSNPKSIAEFLQTEKGKQFLADCKKYGIMVEHQFHAMHVLLPRELFDTDPSMFRMDENGKRVKEWNLCVHSEKALDTVAKNAAHYAEIMPADNHRYYFWLDDVKPVCACPECSKYLPSEQAVMVENRMIKELRKVDAEAQLAHLAYASTMPAPHKVKPEEGIFLEFAPISRGQDTPLSEHKASMQFLKDNLEVFPAETTVVLEYWLDVSLHSKYKKPAVKVNWNKAVCEDDLKTYAGLGIRNFTTFAVWIDGEYFKNHGSDLQFLKEYGDLLNGLKLPNKP